MAEENLGDIRGGFLSKFNQIHTPRTITTLEDENTTFNRIAYPWFEIIFPVTLIAVSFISVVFVFMVLIFWLKYSPKKYEAKMSNEINRLEENMVCEQDLTEETKLVFNFKDRLDQCNEFESYSDENHSPNIEKFNKNSKCDINSSKLYDAATTSDSKKQYIPHSAPPLEMKYDVSMQPGKETSNSFKSTTPSIFKFELKSVSPLEISKEKNTNIFNFSLNSPFSSDSVAYYTPKTSCISEDSPESNRSDIINSSTLPSLDLSKYNDPHVEDIDDRTINSPKSCEYYSAKSTVKNSYEYFKFPDPNLPESYDISEINNKKSKEIVTKNDHILENMISTENLNIEASAIMHRRARLKSISLDSESANLVEAHLSVPMINLIKTQDCITPNIKKSEEDENISSISSKKFRNLKSLTLNLDYKDETLQDSSKLEEELPKTPKTPTLTQSKQKAISLDSSDAFTPLVRLPRGSANNQNSSASVPNTPKRFLKKVSHKPPNLVKSSYYTCFSDSLNMSGIGECLPASRSFSQRLMHNSLRSKINNLDENPTTNKVNDSQIHLGASNLHLFKNPLSVSNNNLKTLPEVMPLSDFNVPASQFVQEPPEAQYRKSILQRRGSNQSLTLNLDSNLRSSQCLSLQGSVSNLFHCHALSASNYSIYEHSTNNSKKSKCLLQRRVSNQNLSHLNLNNRFSSQSLLGINNSSSCSSNKKGLLERRNSNTSLTLNLSNSFQGVFSHCAADTIQPNEPVPCSPSSLPDYHSPHRHRKSLSTECLLENSEIPSAHTQHSARDVFGSADCVASGDFSFRTFRQKGVSSGFDGPPRLITTRPLSPQADSEDFRMHLANLETLRSASNVLCRQQLKELQIIFERGYQANKDVKEVVLNTSQKEINVCDATIQITNKSNSGQTSNINNQTNKTSGFESDQPMEILEYTHNINEQTKKNIDSEDKSANKSTSVSSNIDKFFSTSAGLASNNLEHHKKMLLLSLHREFWSLPNNFQDKPMVYGSQSRNRYKSILPNEHSRVVLDEKTSCNMEGYINANYIKGYDNLTEAYIVTQGPLSNTIYDFWSMVYQNVSQFLKKTQECNLSEKSKQPKNNFSNHQKIVMLTGLAESNYQKCSPYFPAHNGESMKFSFDGNSYVLGDNLNVNSNTVDSNGKYSVYEVKNAGVLFKQGYSLRRLFVKRKVYSGNEKQINQQNQDCIEVFHYWFEGWPDHKSPDDVHVLLDMCLHILDADCASEFSTSDYLVLSDQTFNKTIETQIVSTSSEIILSSPPTSPLPIIHCSAGIGRTGCLVALLNGVRQLRDTEKVDILGIVSAMRLARGGMVQNSEQYELIHRALCAYEQRFSREKDVIK